MNKPWDIIFSNKHLWLRKENQMYAKPPDKSGVGGFPKTY